jgi:hypothetical protein
MRALDAHSAAGNRLLLIAPEAVLERIEVLNDLLSELRPRDEDWREKWRTARGALVAPSRACHDCRDVSADGAQSVRF